MRAVHWKIASMRKDKKQLVESFGDISQIDDDDKSFWKNLTTQEKWTAAWEIVVDHYTAKGKASELRLCRSIETAGEA